MHHNGLSSAELLRVWIIQINDAVSFAGQFLNNMNRDTWFKGTFIALNIPEPGGIESCLHIHAEVDNVEQHLDVSLRLHEATHDAEGEEQVTVAEGHGRDNGVIWSLMRLDAVGMALLKSKQATTILEADASICYDDAGAKWLVKAIDERDTVTVSIRHRQVDGVFLSIQEACLHPVPCLVPVYKAPSSLCVRFGE